MLKQRLTGLAAVLLGVGITAITGDGTVSLILLTIGLGGIFCRQQIAEEY